VVMGIIWANESNGLDHEFDPRRVLI